MPYTDKNKQREAQKRYEEKRKVANGLRYRCWTLIFYPDSAPEEWRDMLAEKHVPMWVSPLHDRDVWTKADEKKNSQHVVGERKKPHYHLIVQYDSVVNVNTCLRDFACLNGPQNVEHVESLTSMVRYLVHADDPDKAQYERADVLTFGGADKDIVEQLGTHERHEALKAMRRFIREHGIVNYCDFVDYCDECEATWAHLLDDNSCYTIQNYIKSMRYKLLNESSAISAINVEHHVGEAHKDWNQLFAEARRRREE